MLFALVPTVVAQNLSYYDVAGAPAGCSAAYVLPRSAPMMAEGYSNGFVFEQGELMGAADGACSRMLPHDGSAQVWTVMLWQDAFRGNVFCTDGQLTSPVLVVGDPSVETPATVKVRWYLADVDRGPGSPPSKVSPCAIEAPKPSAEVIAALHPPPPSPQRPLPQRPLLWVAALDTGPSRVLDGWAIGGRAALGKQYQRVWLGAGLSVNTWQALPVDGAWWYSSTLLAPTLWGQLLLDKAGQLRGHVLAGGGPNRLRREDDGVVQGRTTVSALGMVGLSYRLFTVNLGWVGPGGVICAGDPDCDIGSDVQITGGVMLMRR